MSEQDQLAQQALSLNLYLLTPELSEIESPTADVMAELCQNPSIEQTNCLYIQDYQIDCNTPEYAELLTSPESVQLHISNGPSLGVLVECGEQIFVSEQISYMPEFDLGLDEDED
jgi:hypothetical protein